MLKLSITCLLLTIGLTSFCQDYGIKLGCTINETYADADSSGSCVIIWRLVSLGTFIVKWPAELVSVRNYKEKAIIQVVFDEFNDEISVSLHKGIGNDLDGEAIRLVENSKDEIRRIMTDECVCRYSSFRQSKMLLPIVFRRL